MSGRILKISFVCLLCTCFAWTANAVPTVKKLGTSATTHSTTTTKASTGSTARTGVARLNTSNAIKPGVKTTTAKKTTVTKTNTATAPTAESGSDARISLGKYLHGANVVKQNAAQAAYEDPNLASRDSLILREKLADAEADVADVKQDMQDHINNTDVHVTLGDKDKWNDKQDALTAGEGIVIEENVISSVMKLPVGSENAPRTAPIWIE